MTADAFRTLALRIPGAIESAHMHHPDFRIGGKIFATLGYPDPEHGMVKLTPEQQKVFGQEAPRVFTPCNGAWGKGGATCMRLAATTKPLAQRALNSAAKNRLTGTKKKTPASQPGYFIP